MLKFLLLFMLTILLVAGCGVPDGDEPLQSTGEAAADVLLVQEEPDIADTADTPATPEVLPDAADAEGAQGSLDVSGTQQGFMFKAYGQEIFVCMEAAPILGALPEPQDIFEAPSCAFDGIDITYFYPGFELTTYPDSGKEYVLSVVFKDDSVTTPEGIYIGLPADDVQRAYGSGYTEDGNRYIYANGLGELIFTLADGVVMGVIYSMILEG